MQFPEFCENCILMKDVYKRQEEKAVKAGWVNGLNWLNWGEKNIMHKMLGGMWSSFG